MKVKELISQLEKLDGNLEVLCYSENNIHDDVVSAFYMIEDVSVAEGEKKRDLNGRPGIKFGKSGDSVKCALISIESDF
jgi:hypothetical protein